MANSPDDLIDKLSEDLEPVKPDRPFEVQVVGWVLLLVIGCGIALAAVQAFRPGFYLQLGVLPFFVEVFLGVLLIISSAYYIFRSSVPGMPVRTVQRVMPYAFLFGFCLFLAKGLIFAPAIETGQSGHRSACYLEIIFLGGLASALLAWRLKKSFPPRNRRFAFQIGLAGAAIPAVSMEVACMYEPAHNLIFHVGPMILVALITSQLAMIFLSKAD